MLDFQKEFWLEELVEDVSIIIEPVHARPVLFHFPRLPNFRLLKGILIKCC